MECDIRKLFSAWAQDRGDQFLQQQWLLSKWDNVEGVIWSEDKIRLMREDILRKLDLNEQDHLVDLGCGGGWLLKEVRPYVKDALGLDFSLEMLRTAQKVSAAGRYLCADICSLPFRSGSIHKVLCYFVLINFMDIHQIEQAFLEIYRVLRPGGKALIGQLPDKDKSGVYDTQKESYLEYCKSEFNLGEDLRDSCHVPLNLFDRDSLLRFFNEHEILFSIRPAFNPFYRAGEPASASWRFDLLLEKK